ncbi:MAG: hypothetical protein GY930_18550 [bacterium]|nr:hypothetical protein [bacterium]
MCEPSQVHTPEDEVRRLAGLLFDDFVRAEGALLDPSQVSSGSAARGLFCSSFLAEYGSQSGSPIRDELPAPLDVMTILGERPNHRLSNELCAYWYPGWRRHELLFCSPVDHLSGPQSLAAFLKEGSC